MPIISYSYSFTLPIASKIVNYKTVLQDLKIEDFKLNHLTVLDKTHNPNSVNATSVFKDLDVAKILSTVHNTLHTMFIIRSRCIN